MAILSEKDLTAPASDKPGGCTLKRRLRQLGGLCFLFFLIKGLLWLMVPAGLYLLSTQ